MANTYRDLPILEFCTKARFASWMGAQPKASKGLWLKLAKKASGIETVSQQDAIETALCHGWIDGQLDKFDEAYWLVRFTPRKPRSKWSEVNRTKAMELIANGHMKPAGLREIERAKVDGRWNAAYAPQSTAAVPRDLQAALNRNKIAKHVFEKLDGKNRYAILHRVQDVKKAETRRSRIEKYVSMLSRGETIYPRKAQP